MYFATANSLSKLIGLMFTIKTYKGVHKQHAANKFCSYIEKLE